MPKTHEKNEIVIALLGESGVGKSTFINALVNYMAFDNLTQAQCGEPIAVTPVSFTTTINNDFDEVLVQFGERDPNENHNDQGQSVTQQCRSYLLDIDSRNRFRFIDTPGFADTRGVEQDEKNFSQILAYLSNFRRIHVICFLLKPNSTRLNVIFQQTFRKIFQILPSNKRQNIFFCFTNTRSTFYAPAETGALIRRHLQSEKMNDVEFSKKSVFCFDSESFRFLMAVRVGVTFDNDLVQEYHQSWSVSVKEVERFIRGVVSLQPFNFVEHQSIQKLSNKIIGYSYMLMEIVRSMVYKIVFQNQLLYNQELSIETKPTDNSYCSSCADIQVIHLAKIPIFRLVYRKSNCSHSNPTNFMIELLHEYSISNTSTWSKRNIKEAFLQEILNKITQLSYFVELEFRDDIDFFELVLDRFISEQEKIVMQRGSSENISEIILNKFKEIKMNLRREKEQLRRSRTNVSMKMVVRVLEELIQSDIVKNQIESIEASRVRSLEKSEVKLKAESIRSRRFTDLFHSIQLNPASEQKNYERYS